MSVAAVADKIAVTSVSNRLATSGGDFDDRQGGKLYRRTETFSLVLTAATEKIRRGHKSLAARHHFSGGAGADCYTAAEFGCGAAFCLAQEGKVTAAQGSPLDHTLLP